MLEKVFLKNITLLILINILIKPIYLFGIDAQVQNVVGADYGIYFALFNFAFLFQIILDPGIQNFNSTRLSQNRENLNTSFPSVFTTKLLLASIFAILVYGVAFLIYPKFYLPQLLLIIGVQILASIFLFLRSHLGAMGKFKQDVYFSGLDKLIMIALIGYFLYFRSIDIECFLKLQIVSFLIAIFILCIFLKFSIKLNYKLSLANIIPTVKAAMPFGFVFLLMTLYTRMDGVMLERILRDDGYEANIYAAAYRLLDAANMIGVLFASLLLPMFANMIKDRKGLDNLSQLALRILLFFACLIILSSYFFGQEILSLIYINLTETHTSSFKLLMISFLALSISYVYGTMITASSQLKVFNLIFLVGIILNWTLNLILIPKQGAVGAAIATLITQFAVMIGQTLLAFKRFNLRFDVSLVFRYVSLFLIGIISFYFLRENIALSWPLQLIIGLILLTFISILIGFVRLKWVFGMAFE